MIKHMKGVAFILGSAVLLTQAGTSLALPTYGANCSNCHGTALGTITIIGNDTTANPVEGCGTPDLGVRPVFQVAQGGTKTLSGQVSGLPSGAAYAAVLKNFQQNGVVTCSPLTYTPDSTWSQHTSPAPAYYTLPLTGSWYTAPSGATSFPFSITVGAATPADYYDLVLAVAGLSGGTFYCESHFYVQVTAAAPVAPTIALDKTALSPTAAQGSSPPNDTFNVSNTGAGTLNYTITADATWLTATPASGSTTGPAVPITVQYSTALLAAGTYTATITVSDATATNNPQTIGVTLTINVPTAPPAISLSTASLNPVATQPANPPNDTFTVSNIGGGTLNYTIAADAAWLTASPATGSTTGPANTITVQYDTATLTAGTYTATISATDAAASNSPQSISVSLTINPAPPPTITLSTASLTPTVTQGSDPPNGAFTISNTGGGTLNYIIAADVSWLAISPITGSISTTVDTIAVQFNAASLAAGTYPATITVSDPNATNNPQTISIVLTVNPVTILRPAIVLSTTSLAPTATEGVNPPDDSFTVANGGTGTLNYTVVADAAWLLVTRVGGSTTGPANTVGVTYLTRSMAVGTYSATIKVADSFAPNSPQVIDVTLTISDSAPAPAPAPGGLCGLGFPLLGATMLCVLLLVKTDRARRRTTG
ncbi:MAG TPA: hypothetical protein VMV94_02240 [Phycisphaerae bacterium]|nr:hypothetical protein [Phycisphaerae bacterium]